MPSPNRKKILILGATGSIGVQSLHVVEQLPDEFEVVGLTTHRNVERLLEQAAKHRPQVVAVTEAGVSSGQRALFDDFGARVFSGQTALEKIVHESDIDLLVNAVVGSAGFTPTLAAVERGTDVALANKETLVMGGSLVMPAAEKHGCRILPIDSEHSAIFQCLMGEDRDTVEEIILTASGGPFRALPKEEFVKVTVEQALKHPNWDMGPKITIDSATMMNKGLEVIEAHWLFGVPVERVRVVIHPQSIIHSMVAFHDGSIKAQMGVPDMRVPIQLAMTYPERKPSAFPRLDFKTRSSLTFEEPDLDKFRALALAYRAADTGGSAPAVMNAANEEAVGLFLNKVIRFDQIAESIERALDAHKAVQNPDAQMLIDADRRAREFVRTEMV